MKSIMGGSLGPELVVHFKPELVAHIGPELVVHFKPELVAHIGPEIVVQFKRNIHKYEDWRYNQFTGQYTNNLTGEKIHPVYDYNRYQEIRNETGVFEFRVVFEGSYFYTEVGNNTRKNLPLMRF